MKDKTGKTLRVVVCVCMCYRVRLEMVWFGSGRNTKKACFFLEVSSFWRAVFLFHLQKKSSDGRVGRVISKASASTVLSRVFFRRRLRRFASFHFVHLQYIQSFGMQGLSSFLSFGCFWDSFVTR